ncbi:early boundary activity protein 3 [Drosophila sechellia]|uniref:GM18486 n=1 Tax=Drosophila sechellia TaxID=7238 RepID=B4I3B6_DROSE|nr:early boundary activity protein 3 [Drosophila sechellia]EDW54261.1 GM18486 [Drosophila sechellia]
MSNISNDSGLDDSANSGAVVSANGPLAATRLSWFLAEVDDGLMKDGKPNGRRRLCVLHSMELLESDVSDKYMTRFVEFRVNGMVLEAKLILAADERRLVDAALLSMSKEEREDAVGQQLLVQYTENEKAGERLIQKLVSPNDVMLLSTKPELKGNPLVSLAPGCIAHILYAYESRDYMEKILLHLKARSFDLAFDDNLEAEPEAMNDDTWMLVQYSPEPEMVVYQVVQYRQTVWRKENLFKDVIAYMQLPGSDIVLQAVVISYGQDKEVLNAKYEELRRFPFDIDFPLPDELEKHPDHMTSTALFSRTSLYQKAEQRDTTGKHKELRKSLEQMSEKAQGEAQMIIDAFDMVDNINKNLQSRLSGEVRSVVEVTSGDELH